MTSLRRAEDGTTRHGNGSLGAEGAEQAIGEIEESIRRFAVGLCSNPIDPRPAARETLADIAAARATIDHICQEAVAMLQGITRLKGTVQR